jgi:hypothetical protein
LYILRGIEEIRVLDVPAAKSEEAIEHKHEVEMLSFDLE